MTADILDELERLERAAYPLPWTIRATAHPSQKLLVRGDEFLRSTQLPAEDVDLIGTLRNAAPQLIAIAKAANVLMRRSGITPEWECSHGVLFTQECCECEAGAVDFDALKESKR